MAQEKGKGGERKESGAKGDDYEFIPPDFDEDAFIHREIVSFRTTLILFVWGIVAAAVSWAAFAGLHGAQVGWLVGLAIVAVFGYALRWIFPRLKTDISHFGRREWAGTAALFFFTWLAFFILAINPPVSDFAPPRVDLHASPFVQQSGANVQINLFVEDNQRVTSHHFTVHRVGGDVLAGEGDLAMTGIGHYQYVTGALQPGLYALEASATDAAGHRAQSNLTFVVVDQAIRVTLPASGKLAARTDVVFAEAVDKDLHPCTTKKGVVNNAPCVRTVQVRFGPGRPPIDMEYSAVLGGWQATSNFVGWAPGANNFTVAAELLSSYAGSAKVDGGAITAGPYNVTVTDAIGTYLPTVIPDASPHQRKVPGLELPVLALALLAAALVLRRR